MKHLIVAAAMLSVSLIACNPDPMATLPDFNFRLSDSTTVMNSDDIPKGKAIVLINFEADCTDCQKFTDSLLLSINTMKNVSFYFLTTEQFSKVTLFSDHYKFDQYPNIIVGQDYSQFLPQHFKSHTTPLIALYNKNKTMVGYFEGKPANKVLLNAIQNIQ